MTPARRAGHPPKAVPYQAARGAPRRQHLLSRPLHRAGKGPLRRSSPRSAAPAFRSPFLRKAGLFPLTPARGPSRDAPAKPRRSGQSVGGRDRHRHALPPRPRPRRRAPPIGSPPHYEDAPKPTSDSNKGTGTYGFPWDLCSAVRPGARGESRRMPAPPTSASERASAPRRRPCRSADRARRPAPAARRGCACPCPSGSVPRPPPCRPTG